MLVGCAEQHDRLARHVDHLLTADAGGYGVAERSGSGGEEGVVRASTRTRSSEAHPRHRWAAWLMYATTPDAGAPGGVVAGRKHIERVGSGEDGTRWIEWDGHVYRDEDKDLDEFVYTFNRPAGGREKNVFLKKTQNMSQWLSAPTRWGGGLTKRRKETAKVPPLQRGPAPTAGGCCEKTPDLAPAGATPPKATAKTDEIAPRMAGELRARDRVRAGMSKRGFPTTRGAGGIGVAVTEHDENTENRQVWGRQPGAPRRQRVANEVQQTRVLPHE